MSFIPFLMGAADMGAAGAGSASQSGSFVQMIITFGLIFVVMYFLIFRPQKKKEQETKNMIDALKKGDKVVTIGGIHGVVSSTKEKTIVVKVDDNTKIEFNRTAIATVLTDKPATPAAKQEKKSFFSFGKKNDEQKTAETTAANDAVSDTGAAAESTASANTDESKN